MDSTDDKNIAKSISLFYNWTTKTESYPKSWESSKNGIDEAEKLLVKNKIEIKAEE